MRVVLFITCIITFNAYSQDCHIPVMNYHPKEIIGNYSLYKFTPGTDKKSKDSVLLVTSVYDSIQRIQIKTMYADVHKMAGSFMDPGIHKIHLDSNGNIICRKIYAEGKTYNGKYKYIGLDECTYDNFGNILSESTYGTSNVPVTFVYTDSTFEQVIKQNYSHRAGPDCISRYHYEYRRIAAIENYKDGALLFKNELSYTSLDVMTTKAYKPDGTLFSLVEFNYSPKGFTQTLYYYFEQNKELKKEEDFYYWKYKKERGRIVEIEYGKNGALIDRNKYVYDKNGRIILIKMYDKKALVHTYKYFYE
jgi:hypothetical protein